LCEYEAVSNVFDVAYVASTVEASKWKDNSTVAFLVSLCLWLKHKELKIWK